MNRLTIAPGLQQTLGGDFDISYESLVTVGGTAWFSRSLCVTPKHPLYTGSYAVATAPYGGVFARDFITIYVPELPVAQASDFSNKSISTARPLSIALSSADVINQYAVSIGGDSTACEAEATGLSCDITQLSLRHGSTYPIDLIRTFAGEGDSIASGTITTLEPLKAVNSSITAGAVVYDTPNTFEITFDAPLDSAKVSMTSGGASVATTQSIDGVKLIISFDALKREADYTIKVEDAVATSGSSLAAPLEYTFKTSGGPAVKSVSVGSSGVARATSIVVTLDQPIADGTDITKFAAAGGIPAQVSLRSPTEIIYTISGGDCAAFTLNIKEGLASGVNKELSKAWTFSSRTICGYTWTIGTSVQGRTITAYSFGSGSKVLLFTGGMHGSEYSGYATMLAWAQYLQQNGHIVPADKRVVIVPNTNPDGIAAGTRYNSRDVNIDRNFPASNWSASIDTATGVLPKGGGESAGSEPETQALISLVQQLRPTLEISYHSQGRLVGANKYGNSVAVGQQYANTVGYSTMFTNAEEVMGYSITGEFEDWMGEALGIPAILIELPAHSGNYLTSQLDALKALLSL